MGATKFCHLYALENTRPLLGLGRFIQLTRSNQASHRDWHFANDPKMQDVWSFSVAQLLCADSTPYKMLRCYAWYFSILFCKNLSLLSKNEQVFIRKEQSACCVRVELFATAAWYYKRQICVNFMLTMWNSSRKASQNVVLLCGPKVFCAVRLFSHYQSKFLQK